MTTPYFFFTFRPQISEQDLFEDFIILFLPLLKGYPEWAYVVEKDDSNEKHLHALWRNDTATEFKKAGIFKRKPMLQFQSALFNKQTTYLVGYNNQKVSEEDFLDILGYIMKETSPRRRETTFTDERELEAHKYYYAKQRIKSEQPRSDLIVLNGKTVHSAIKHYCVENKLEPTYGLTKLRMIKDGFMFSQVSHLEETKNEVEQNMFPDRFPSDTEQTSYYEMKSEVQRMMEQLESMTRMKEALEKKFQVKVKKDYFTEYITIVSI